MNIDTGAIAQLAAAIQRQMAASNGAAVAVAGPGRKAVPRAAARSAARPVASGWYVQENLASLIELRVAQIARDDAQRGRKAFRVFLEAVLLSQLGEQLLNDPKFFQLVDDIQFAMEAEPGCRLLIDSAIAQLLSDK